MLSLVDLRVLEIIVAYANAPLIFVQSQMSFRVSSRQRSAVSGQQSAVSYQLVGWAKSDAARSWEGSAVLGVPPMSDCRGFPHERLHQDTV